ncbi:hypothetical protein R3398_17155 [Rossellomorea marisflavi]|uniref:hypothetical protein n=1 Tax=Rossellomorea marisflavi TaxID=189381 RepID=UPI00296EC313|nr:hypothetical protein [Rossellomorea marisflavi]MDW4528097.1 hypothetical protein [Rossellomorea marisflavi]
MNQFITIVIFTLPGLLTYFWINLFGITPSVRKNNNEVTAISVLLWIPIVGMVFLIYNLSAYLINLSSTIIYLILWAIGKKYLEVNYSIPLFENEITYISSFEGLVNLSGEIWFVLFYVLLTIVISFILANTISRYAYEFILNKVNGVRKRNNIAPLGVHTTVWDSVFLNNKGQVIECKKDDFSKIGLLLKVPRAHESTKAIVLEGVDHWTLVFEYYNVEIDYTYVDTDSGLIINIYNSNKAQEAQKQFNERFPSGVTSSASQVFLV